MQDNQMSDWQRRFEERGLRFEEAAVERRLLSNAVNSVEAGDFSTPLRCGRNDMKGRSAARVQMVQRVQRFKGWWWRLCRSMQAPSCGRSQTLRVFAMVSYVVGCVEAGDFGAPLPTLEMTSGRGFQNEND